MSLSGRRTRRAGRWTAALLALALCALLGAGAASAARAAPSRTLRVAFPQVTGISEVDQYGNHTGLMVDYLNEIAKYTGWAYEYVSVGAEDLIDRFLAGEFDLMGGTFYSPGFEEYFGYPDYTTGRSVALLICRQDDEDLKSYDLTTMNGKTIGVYENATEKIRYLEDYLASNDLDCRLRYYTHEDMNGTGNLYHKLLDGEVDMLLGNEQDLGGQFRMVTYFQAQPFYIVTRVGDSELLDGLNTALAYIAESTPTFAQDAFSANFPDLMTIDIQLNEEELRYVAQKGTVTVAVPTAWHPLYCLDSPLDQHEGMLADLLAEISAFTGLEFTYVYADTYAQSLEMVRQGQADILGAYLGSEEEAFALGLSLTRTYIDLSNVVLKHKSVDYPAQGLTCGILTGRTLPPSFQAVEVCTYDTVSQLVAAVNRHEVDYIYGISALLEQEMQAQRYINVVPVAQASDNTGVSFAVPQPAQPALLTVLNKAISHIPSGERVDMLNRNLVSVGYSTLSLQDLIYDNPALFAAILVVLLGAVIAVVAVIMHNRMKNTVMESKLRAAEAKSEAKSEFLSRMSHEIRTPMNAITGLVDLACRERDLPPPVEEKLRKLRGSSRYLLALINDILDMSRIENQRMKLEHQNFSLSGVLEDLREMMSTQAEQKDLQFQLLRRLEHEWLVGDPIRLRQILTNLLSNAMKFTPSGGVVLLQVEEQEGEEGAARYRFSVADNGIGIPPEDTERIFAAFEQVEGAGAHGTGTGLGLPISRSLARLMGGDLQVRSKVGTGSEFYMTLTFPLGQEGEEQDVYVLRHSRSLEGVRALLAEDNDLNAEIAQELLNMHGVLVLRAENGQAAVDLFRQSEPGTYQVVLMDIRMPVMDGYQAAQQIRASDRPDANVPIVAMTANSFKEDEDAARAAGMNGFVPKPVDVNLLLRVLHDLL